MKIARIQSDDGSAFAVLAGDGTWVHLASLGIQADTTADVIQAEAALRAAQPRAAGGVSDPTFLCPIVKPPKIMAIGLNYMDHIRETSSKAPEQPILFAKFASSLNDPYGRIVIDDQLTAEGDYETELAVIIGQTTRNIGEDESLSRIFAYTIGNDVSARDAQRRDGQLVRSKSFDTFCPMGPWLTTADEVADPQDLPIRTWVNGELRQNSSTREMLFPVRMLISYLARGMTLEPGDVLLSGTPHGVGFAMKPPRQLVPGDVVESEVGELGRLRNEVVGPDR